jgi:retinol dehydrogenase 12
MEVTATRREPGDVRVLWAASLAAEVSSPRYGVDIDQKGNYIVSKSNNINYGASKCGNIFYASEYARRCPKSKVVHLVNAELVSGQVMPVVI